MNWIRLLCQESPNGYQPLANRENVTAKIWRKGGEAPSWKILVHEVMKWLVSLLGASTLVFVSVVISLGERSNQNNAKPGRGGGSHSFVSSYAYSQAGSSGIVDGYRGFNREFKTLLFVSRLLPPTTHFPDCKRVVENDAAYIKQEAKHRVAMNPDTLNHNELKMDCTSIRARNFFPTLALSIEEAQYPIAQARIAYRDYFLLEMDLAAAYQPQNWYCYAVDSKADRRFHSRVRSLAKCLPNVLVTSHEYEVDSWGRNMFPSFFECLKLLLEPRREWRYVSLLQNHDITVKTNREAVQIFKLLNGANDVEVIAPPRGRVDTTLDWSFHSLHLFRNESRNHVQLTPNGFPTRLTFAKGYVECSLRREMAEFMVNELDISGLMARLEMGHRFGIDELLIPTIHASDALQAPGGFTHSCLDKKQFVKHITRKSKWVGSSAHCASRHSRHMICLLGLEDVGTMLSRIPHLFANKMMPDFDLGAILCWYERMSIRTYRATSDVGGMGELDVDFYRNLPHVRFQSFKQNFTSIPEAYQSMLASFNCSSNLILPDG